VIEGILWLLGEILFQVVGELLFEFGLGSISHSMKDRETSNPYMSGAGFVLLGALSGLVVTWLLPERIIPTINLHGSSTVLAAVGTGYLMMLYGRWRIRRGGHPTYLATFWGGGLFAFSMSLTRWFLVEI